MAHIKMNGSGNISENVENLCMPEDIYRGFGKPSGKPKSWGHLTGFVCCYLAWPNKRSWGTESSRGVPCSPKWICVDNWQSTLFFLLLYPCRKVLANMHAEHAKRGESDPRLGAGSIQPGYNWKTVFEISYPVRFLFLGSGTKLCQRFGFGLEFFGGWVVGSFK